MSLRVEVENAVNAIDLLQRLPQIAREEVSREAEAAAAEVAQLEVIAHFDALNAQPNARRWPKRNFWADVAAAVGVNRGSEGTSITVANIAFFRRWKGGAPITPKTRKHLARPVIAEAYAAGSPGEGGAPVELALVIRRIRGRAQAIGLGEDVRVSKRGRRYAVGRLWYRFSKAYNPPADERAFPEAVARRIEGAALAEALEFVRRRLAEEVGA